MNDQPTPQPAIRCPVCGQTVLLLNGVIEQHDRECAMWDGGSYDLPCPGSGQSSTGGEEKEYQLLKMTDHLQTGDEFHSLIDAGTKWRPVRSEWLGAYAVSNKFEFRRPVAPPASPATGSSTPECDEFFRPWRLKLCQDDATKEFFNSACIFARTLETQRDEVRRGSR